MRTARREVVREEERLLGSLALAEETVHRILLTAEIGAPLRRMAVDCVEVLDLAGVRIELDPAGVGELEPEDTRVQHGSCEGENTQRLPIRARLTGIGIENLLSHRQVRHANDDKRRFILATTHDLRSPMTTVEQIVTVLLDGYAGPLADKQRDLLEKIRARSEHQLELLTDLLNLAAELEGFAVLRESVSVDLGEILDRQAGWLDTQCETRGLTCETRRDAGSIRLTAVPSDLENILGNLFSNAVKYTKPSGRVTATLEAHPGQCRLRVSDSGIGIPSESMANLFKEYFRAPNAREMTRHGTGLGLALVQHLVRKYDGRIHVESHLNEGTTFEVTLPVDEGGAT